MRETPMGGTRSVVEAGKARGLQCGPAPAQFFGNISPSWGLALGPGQLGGVAVDGTGNIIVAGKAFGTLSIGATAYAPPGAGGFVIKVDSQGNSIWQSTLGATDIASIGTDGAGNIYVAGAEAGNSGSLVLAKLDPSGAMLWSHGFAASAAAGGSPASSPSVSLSVSPSGTVAVMGVGAFGPAFGVATADASTDPAFVATFGPDSSLLYAKVFGAWDAVGGLDSAGDLYLSGWFNGALDLGNVTASAMGTQLPAFAAKLDPGGNVLWSEVVPGGGGAVAITQEGPVLAGVAPGTIGQQSSTPAARDLFVDGLNSAGQSLFSTAIPSGPCTVSSACADPTGGFVLVGTIFGETNLGGGLLQPVPDFGDVFLAKFDSAGHQVSSAGFGRSPIGAGLSSVAVDATGNVIVGGSLGSATDFGIAGGPLPPGMIIAKFAQQPSNTARPPCPADLYGDGGWPEAGVLVAPASAGTNGLGTATKVALSPSAVYWTTGTEVMSEQFATGQPTVIALNQAAIVDLAIDSHSLYWANSPGQYNNLSSPGAIVAAALDGGPPITLAISPDSPQAIAVDDTALYWTAGGAETFDGGTTPGLVLSVPLDGGAVTNLTTVLGRPGPIAAGNGVVVFATANGGTGASQVAIVSRDGGTPSILATSGTPVVSIALDSATAYWSNESTPGVDVSMNNGGVLAVPLAGGSPSGLVGGLSDPGQVMVVGATLYWSNGGSFPPTIPSAGIWSKPTTGGTATALIPMRLGVGNFAVDAAHVAWVDEIDLEDGVLGLFVMSR